MHLNHIVRLKAPKPENDALQKKKKKLNPTLKPSVVFVNQFQYKRRQCKIKLF